MNFPCHTKQDSWLFFILAWMMHLYLKTSLHLLLKANDSILQVYAADK